MNAFSMTPEEIQHWERDGYFVRAAVFSHEENDLLRQVAETGFNYPTLSADRFS